MIGWFLPECIKMQQPLQMLNDRRSMNHDYRRGSGNEYQPAAAGHFPRPGSGYFTEGHLYSIDLQFSFGGILHNFGKHFKEMASIDTLPIPLPRNFQPRTA